MNSWKLGHRSSLDGLRGIAILLVLAGHLNLTGLDSGGWVGVTMFFALSGFLITTILVEEHDRTGGMDFVAFYVRRASRLLPALAIFLTAVVVWRLAIGATEHIKWQTASVALYFGNWYRLWAIDDLGPLAHTWSLAIEEQFYLLWPVVLLILLALTRGDRGRIIHLLVGAAVVGMVWRFVLWHDVSSSVDRIYVGTDTRADALLLGAALSISLTSGRLWTPSRLLTVVAVAAMYPFVWFADGTHLQDQSLIGLAVCSVASVVVVAYAATHPARLLALPPLIFFGRISYGLYLWQYPAFVVAGSAAAATINPLGVPAMWWAVLIAILISVASSHLVEQPILAWSRRWAVRRREASEGWSGVPQPV